MDVLARHNVTVAGRPAGPPMVFSHGFGCDQQMWRYVWPSFTDRFRVVLFDHIGAGGSSAPDYDAEKYSSLNGYAQDVLEICHALELSDVTFVGHSVSAMIGVSAYVMEPDLFSSLILVSPSPRYVDDAGYVGGFSADDITDLLDAVNSNYLGWSAAMAPTIMANPDRPELGRELTESFCRSDPEIARRFARVTFLSDSRADLPKVRVPSLVLQCSDDVIAPMAVGEYVRDAMPDAELVVLNATGHCPNLSAPEETARAMRQFMDSRQLPRA
jgi:sigma-B regulation protein RsbQ